MSKNDGIFRTIARLAPIRNQKMQKMQSMMEVGALLPKGHLQVGRSWMHPGAQSNTEELL